MRIKEIKTHKEISQTFPTMSQLYENLDDKTYLDDVSKLMQQDYLMAGVFESDEKKCIGVVGIKITKNLQHGKAMEIQDFMIAEDQRGIGVGKMLMHWVEGQAANFDCKIISGNLETKRLESQKIFSREGFILDGFSFRKIF